MKITTVLFDLDGTLLPMELDSFIKAYFTSISEYLAPHGYDPKLLAHAVWQGFATTLANDGTKPNEDLFWEGFSLSLGKDARADEQLFRSYYESRFDDVGASCGKTEHAKEIVSLVKAKGLTPVLATNPVYPMIATEHRIKWAGLSPSDFALITAYENSCYCKPKDEYYRMITERLGVCPEECLMIGNDVDDDMPAERLGMRVFLLTDCLINKNGADISRYAHGSFDELARFIEAL